VESVLAQPGVDVQVLIIDDASPDNTHEVAVELAVKDPRVQYRRHPSNQGHIATYNEGLLWASGDYTVLLSADDLLTPGALLRATRLLDANPRVGLVYGPTFVFRSGDLLPPARAVTGECRWKIYSGIEWLEKACRLGEGFIWSPEAVVRTSLQQKLGGYLPSLPRLGDQEMWMRFATHGEIGEILDAEQAYYRLHGSNMSAPQFADPLRDLQERKAVFDTVFREYGDRVDDCERLLSFANRRIAGYALSAAGVAFERVGAVDSQVAKLIEFALDVQPGARLSFGYALLRLRIQLGPRPSRFIRSIRRALLPRRSIGHWADLYS
jgi:glycosyltransferase involved in cell wall biosynthesis